jgi:hypothetical protein
MELSKSRDFAGDITIFISMSVCDFKNTILVTFSTCPLKRLAYTPIDAVYESC